MARDRVGQDRATVRRAVAGPVLVGLLALWPHVLAPILVATFALPESAPVAYTLLLGGMLAVGMVGGVFMPFRWAIRVVPAVVIAVNTAELARVAAWPGPVSHDAPGWFFATNLVLVVIPYGVAAALGVFAARAVSKVGTRT